jgi:hypothetical protein
LTQPSLLEETADQVSAAFGAENRARLIRQYFEAAEFDAAQVLTAWAHVYRLLLWVDPITGLAHCYESDKSQPGKNWYARSLAFHEWVSNALNSSPSHLAFNIDSLFRRAASDLKAEVLRNAKRQAAAAAKQRAPFEGRGFPNPGEDPKLIEIFRTELTDYLSREPDSQHWQVLIERVREHFALESKRKNLLGEGFEDVLSHVMRKTCAPEVSVGTRQPIHDIRGFTRAIDGEKPTKVDIAIVQPEKRTLVTVKWSIRADREKQFLADFNDYVYANAEGTPWEYVCVTNEFDPARLRRACEKIAQHTHLFARLVHISTDALRATYGSSREPSVLRVLQYIDEGRLVSLGDWLSTFSA